MSVWVTLLVAAAAVLRTEEEAPRLLPALLDVLQADSAAGFQVPGGVARASPLRSDARMQTDLDDRGMGGEEKLPGNKRFMQSGRKLTKAEFDRKAKIVDSANFPPRTFPLKGEGYFFFQGPTPKTSVQKDLPSFFSKENFEDLQIAPQQIAVTATGLGAAALLAASVVAGDPALNPDTQMQYPATQRRAAVAKKAPSAEAKEKEAAAAKAAKEKEAAAAKAAKEEAAKAKAAAAEKAKAEKAAKAEAAKAEKAKAKAEKAEAPKGKAAPKAEAAKAEAEKAEAEKAEAAKAEAAKAEAAKAEAAKAEAAKAEPAKAEPAKAAKASPAEERLAQKKAEDAARIEALKAKAAAAKEAKAAAR